MSHDVFISYSSHDKPSADAACAILESNGLRCWIAPRDILPGRDWGESIIDAIASARVFLLVFSSWANESGQIKREVERAVSRGIPIIPLRIEDVMPSRSLEYFISTPHWLDAFNPPLQQHLEYLVQVIGSLLQGDRVPPAVRISKPATTAAGREAQPSRWLTPWTIAIIVFCTAAAIGVASYIRWSGSNRVLVTAAALPPVSKRNPAPENILDPKLEALVIGSWAPQGLTCDKAIRLTIGDGYLFITASGKTSKAKITLDGSLDRIVTHADDGDFYYLPANNSLTISGPGNRSIRMVRCAR